MYNDWVADFDEGQNSPQHAAKMARRCPVVCWGQVSLARPCQLLRLSAALIAGVFTSKIEAEQAAGGLSI